MPSPSETVATAYRHFLAGNLAAAEALCRTALSADPRHIDGLHLLGRIALETERAELAVDLIGRAVALQPNSADLHLSLGAAHLLRGEVDQAIACLQRAVAIKPRSVDAHVMLSTAFLAQGHAEEVVRHCKRALTVAPNTAGAHSNLGLALTALGRVSEALGHLRRAATLEPKSAVVQANIALSLWSIGDVEGAIQGFQQALVLDPGHHAGHSGLLMCLNYRANETQETLYAAHRKWGRLHAGTKETHDPRSARADASDRRIRVGYLSSDLFEHPASFFLAPLLQAHDRQEFEIFCYAGSGKSDGVTERLKSWSEHWSGIYGVSDAAAAQRIRDDRIDILVDLCGHTGNNRLAIFARKPAPVQFSWLGYPNTTGLDAIDYRITDAVADPPGADDHLYSERLVRLPRCFLCYAPSDAGPVSPLPALRSSFVTFGSFNVLAKITPNVVEVWARVLRSVANSRLVLKTFGLQEASVRDRVLASFAAAGIEPTRITLRPRTKSLAEHLELYSEIDIALDPFPYNGTTTTCEALWMGVPVVTVRGDRHAGRVGASLLTTVGLEWLIAEDLASYVAIATSLAGDLDRLAALRVDMRARVDASPLCNAASFARAMEEQYRTLWRRWRDEPSPS